MEISNAPLAGKVAVVTGASRGIGRATAVRLASLGADVAICARTGPALDSVKSAVEANSVKCFQRVVDVKNPIDLERFLQDTASMLGPVAMLVNNAGVYVTAPVAEQSLESWREVMATNFDAAMLCCRVVLSDMIDRSWGRIVNISSISGRSGEPYGAAYSASKFALVGLTQSLAVEVAKSNITVNVVCPGWVDTQMAHEQLNDEQWCALADIPREESVSIARLSIPTGRFVEPDEVAALVAFLCSDDARSITGQAINICGGLSLH